MDLALDNKNSIAVRKTVRICFALGVVWGFCSYLWGSSPPNAALYSARWTRRGTLFISFSDVLLYGPLLTAHVFACISHGAVNRSRVIATRVHRTYRVFLVVFSSSRSVLGVNYT